MSTAMTPPSDAPDASEVAGPSRSSAGERSALSVRSMSGEPQTPDQIEAEIEVQREALAETIDALSAKLDVRSQAQAKVDEAKQAAQSKVAQVKHTAQSTVGSAQARLGSAAGTVRHSGGSGARSSSGSSPQPELLAFGVTVLLATVVLWWRER